MPLRTAVLMAALIAYVLILSMAPLRIDGTDLNSSSSSSLPHAYLMCYVFISLQLR